MPMQNRKEILCEILHAEVKDLGCRVAASSEAEDLGCPKGFLTEGKEYRKRCKRENAEGERKRGIGYTVVPCCTVMEKVEEDGY
ncbi:MAG: hypothetical protein JWN14_1887 [Chthonomonadales bacterium]|nr:hypothetical protein [Chthonomonadales bacterium]